MQFWLLFVWLVGLTIAFGAAFFFLPNISAKWTVVATALVALVVRVVPMFLYPESEGFWLVDVGNFERTGDAVLDGRNIYLEPFFVHPYLPFQMYVFAAAKAIADATGTEFFFLMRIPQVGADVGIAVLLVMTTRVLTGEERTAWRAGLLYAICPLAVVTTVYHGQFDVISVFFALLAFFLLLRSPARIAGSAAALGLGILQKVWPVFLLPLFIARVTGWESRLRFCAVALGVVATSMLVHMLVFGSTLQQFIDKVFRYKSPVPRGGGIVLVMDRLPEWIPGRNGVMEWWIDHGIWPAALAFVVVSAVMITQRRDLLDSIIAVLCTLFVLLPDDAGYHYVWIVPFGLAARHSLPVALVVLSITLRFLAIGFFGGGMQFPSPWDGDTARWILEHEWVLGVVAWGTFAAWGVWILAGTGREPRDRQAAAWSPAGLAGVASEPRA